MENAREKSRKELASQLKRFSIFGSIIENPKSLILTSFNIAWLGIPLALIFTIFHIDPQVPSEVFSGLMVVVSVLIGFMSGIIIFYLGKLDENESNSLLTLDEALIEEKYLLSVTKKIYERVMNWEKNTRMAQEQQELLKGHYEGITPSKTTDLTEGIRLLKGLMPAYGIYILISYFLCLVLAISGMLIPIDSLYNFRFTLLFVILTIIIWNLILFYLFWMGFQEVTDMLKKTNRELREHLRDSDLINYIQKVDSVTDNLDKARKE